MVEETARGVSGAEVGAFGRQSVQARREFIRLFLTCKPVNRLVKEGIKTADVCNFE
jgi:hypothetical protein